MGHLIKPAVKRRPRVCISTWVLEEMFWSIFSSIFILCKSYLTRLFPTARLGQFTPKNSRDKNSRKKKGTKNSREKKFVKTVTKKKGMWKQLQKKGTVKKVAKKKRLYIVTSKRVHLQALRCAPVFFLPGGALTIHQAHAPTGFTNKFHSVPSRIREICFGVRGSSIIWIWTMANVLSRGRSCC